MNCPHCNKPFPGSGFPRLLVFVVVLVAFYIAAHH